MRKQREAGLVRDSLQEHAAVEQYDEPPLEVVNDPRYRLVLRVPRRVVARRLASAMVFLVLAFFVASTTSGIGIVIFALCGLAVSGLHVVEARATLALTPVGFTFHGLRSHKVRWRDIERFGVTYVSTRTGAIKMTRYHYTPAAIAARPRRR